MHEINQYQSWKEAFRAEIKKFVSIHQALEVARMNLDQNYQPVKMTEYQASIEFEALVMLYQNQNLMVKETYRQLKII